MLSSADNVPETVRENPSNDGRSNAGAEVRAVVSFPHMLRKHHLLIKALDIRLNVGFQGFPHFLSQIVVLLYLEQKVIKPELFESWPSFDYRYQMPDVRAFRVMKEISHFYCQCAKKLPPFSLSTCNLNET